jgi:DNA-binding MarR family transcriptional regulator
MLAERADTVTDTDLGAWPPRGTQSTTRRPANPPYGRPGSDPSTSIYCINAVRVGKRMARQASTQQAVALQCIRALVKALHQSARAVERRTGVTNAQIFILRQLATTDGLSINAIAERALTGQNTVSTIVARLASRSLVRRGHVLSDGRRVVVTLTPAGRRLLRHAPEPPTERLLAALARMPISSVSALGRTIKALLHAMGASEEVAGMLFENDAVPDARMAERPPRAGARAVGRRPGTRHSAPAQRSRARRAQ